VHFYQTLVTFSGAPTTKQDLRKKKLGFMISDETKTIQIFSGPVGSEHEHLLKLFK
jgi:hypothetical protein